MKKVGRADTAPERSVRRLLWHSGARYRVNVDDLPGSPDIANKSRAKAVFVHGCFWHFHQECDKGRIPERNRDYWKNKFERNRERDRRKSRALRQQGFDVLTVWECELAQPAELQHRLADFWFDADD